MIAAALLGTSAVLPLAFAQAKTAARSSGGSTTVTSASWGITPPTGVSLGTSASYVVATNTGTLSVTAASYSVSVGGPGDKPGKTQVTLRACTGGTWNSDAGTCSGTTTTIGTWTDASTAYVTSTAVPAAAGSSVTYQALATKTGGGSVTADISIQISSGSPRQIQSATTTNS